MVRVYRIWNVTVGHILPSHLKFCESCICSNFVSSGPVRLQFSTPDLSIIFHVTSARVFTRFRLRAHIDRLVQERRNSSALAMEVHLSCTNPSIYNFDGLVQDCSNPSALAMELLQACAKPSKFCEILPWSNQGLGQVGVYFYKI